MSQPQPSPLSCNVVSQNIDTSRKFPIYQPPSHLVPKVYSTNPSIQSIPGLYVFPDYISKEEEQDILNNILNANKWCEGQICRRQQHYGYLYYHTRHHLPELQPKGQNITPLESLPFENWKFLWDRLNERDEMFKDDTAVENGQPQCLVNEYVGSQGISSHVDNTNAFGDIIIGISLVNPIYMTFRKVITSENQQEEETKVLLMPRSCYVLSGEARNLWRHGITHMKQVLIPDEYLNEEFNKKALLRTNDYQRISLTFRYIKIEGTKQVNEDDPNPERLW
ncbi:hypothetical protein ABK040_000113 [Willaertia magna]